MSKNRPDSKGKVVLTPDYTFQRSAKLTIIDTVNVNVLLIRCNDNNEEKTETGPVAGELNEAPGKDFSLTINGCACEGLFAPLFISSVSAKHFAPPRFQGALCHTAQPP